MSSPPEAGRQGSRILRGLVSDLPLADILQFLQVGGKSGILFLGRPDRSAAVIVFRRGRIVQAITNHSYITLGERMIEKGGLTRSKLDDALGYMAHFPGMRIGDALVEKAFVDRDTVEKEVHRHIAETIDRLMSWADAEFEFRIGELSMGRGLPDFAVDFVLERGIEPRQILLEASLLRDQQSRSAAVPGSSSFPSSQDEDSSRAIQWFHDVGAAEPSPADPASARLAGEYLSVSEELFVASERGEMALLLLRFASEFYSDGGLLIRDASGFRLLGQFGTPFQWGALERRDTPTVFPLLEHPFLAMLARDARAFAGRVALAPGGGMIESGPGATESVPVLAVPLVVLGGISLALFCRTPVQSNQDNRALIAIARQVAVALENLTLRQLQKVSEAGVTN